MESKQETESVDMESVGVSQLRDQVWSMSKIKLLENCPLQFYLKYIKKLRFIDEEQDTVERDLGTTIHYLLEMMQLGNTIAEAYELTEQKYFAEIGPEVWPRIIGMLPSVRKFNLILHNKEELAGGYDYVEPEMMMAIDRDYKPVDFFSKDAYFRGVVDYMARKDQDSVVIDYKKGGMGYLTRYHSPQLSSYLLLDYYVNGKFDVGQSYIYYVEAGELSHGPLIKGPMIESHTRPWLDNKIETAIVNVEDAGYFEYKRGNFCKYCDYAVLCKDGKRGTSGSLAKYEVESKEILL